MANTLLTPTMITREALRILHQQCSFVTNIETQYDDRFAQSGAKIGDTITIRKPNRFLTVTGASLSTSNIVEPSTTLQLSTQRHVDFEFSSQELTLNIDDYSKRYIKPAVTQLAASIENDALSMVRQVSNAVSNEGAAATIAKVLAAKVKMDNNLAPEDGERVALVTAQTTADLISAASTLFNASDQISKQYKTGRMGQFAGLTWYTNTLLPTITSGAAATITGYLINNANTLSGASIAVDTGSQTLSIGDTITIEGINAIHPETRVNLGYLKQFRVTAAVASAATSISITPSIVAEVTAYQNVTTGLANNATITKIGTASTTLRPDLFFHKSAFALGTADLVLPNGMDFAGRENFEGISMRVLRQYSINSDSTPARIDVLYGYKTLYDQLACILFNN